MSEDMNDEKLKSLRSIGQAAPSAEAKQRGARRRDAGVRSRAINEK